MKITLLAILMGIAGISLQNSSAQLSAHTNVDQVQQVVASDEDLPFDNSTWLGKAFNWAARILLWFIYLTLFFMAMAITQWFLTAKSFWSWIVCAGGIFFYGMLFGRYWGYGTCLIIFAIVFSAIKIYFTVIYRSTKTKSIMELLVKWNPFGADTRKNPAEQLPKNAGNYNKDENS